MEVFQSVRIINSNMNTLSRTRSQSSKTSSHRRILTDNVKSIHVLTERSGGYCSRPCRILSKISCLSHRSPRGPRNGCAPTRASNNTHPSDQRSTRVSCPLHVKMRYGNTRAEFEYDSSSKKHKDTNHGLQCQQHFGETSETRILVNQCAHCCASE